MAILSKDKPYNGKTLVALHVSKCNYIDTCDVFRVSHVTYQCFFELKLPSSKATVNVLLSAEDQC